VLATVASLVIVFTLIALTYYRLPWRKLPDPGDTPPPPPEVVETTPPAPQTAKPGAYAESP
jgi:alpha-1,6-mannosyltransferase